MCSDENVSFSGVGEKLDSSNDTETSTGKSTFNLKTKRRHKRKTRKWSRRISLENSQKIFNVNKICEEVSSDDYFVSEGESKTTESRHETSNAPTITSNTSDQVMIPTLCNLRDLVEDVSSTSDLESGELSA